MFFKVEFDGLSLLEGADKMEKAGNLEEVKGYDRNLGSGDAFSILVNCS